MDLANIFTASEQLEFVRGIEGQLIKRKLGERVSVFGLVAGVMIQVIWMAANTRFFDEVGKFFINLSWQDPLSSLFPILPQFVGILIAVVAIVTYLLLKRTSFLIKESEQPFQYTFWLEPFNLIKQNPEKSFTVSANYQHELLRYDISERLSLRIRRFSLLNEEDLSDEEKEALISHIHIRGEYAVREEVKGRWIIYVTSRVRVGPPGSPETLSHVVKFPLKMKSDPKANHPSPKTDLDADEYNQLVERVYSSIATEIYRRILSDVKEKITMFPTNYLRCVALFYEAKDFERSNTVDAYGYAIELYKEALHYFDTRLFDWKEDLLLSFPVLLWRLAAKPSLMEADIRIGYCRCLTFRKILSSLSGRRQNSFLFHVPDETQKAICRLEKLQNRINGNRVTSPFLTFPKDSALRRKQYLFDRQRKSLFNAYSVGALAYSVLGATRMATSYLEEARYVDHSMTNEDPLWLLAESEIRPLEERLQIVQQAIEIAPSFEIALYRKAQYSELELRIKNEVKWERVENVVNQYDEVLRINPGNIAALVAQGYLYWLVEKLDEAREKFERGLGYKAIVSETFTGDLNYGLARIAAEKGEFNKSFELYKQAISSSPNVAIYSPTTTKYALGFYYSYINRGIFLRYQSFKKKVDKNIDKIRRFPEEKRYDSEKKRLSERTLVFVYSFMLNDYGNACLNYYHQAGRLENIQNAIRSYEESVKLNQDNAAVYINLENGYKWQNFENGYKSLRDSENKIRDCLYRMEVYSGSWAYARIRSVYSQLEQIDPDITIERNKSDNQVKEIFEKNICRMLSRTAFHSIIKELPIDYDGNGIDDFCKIKVSSDKLNEDDIEVLILWAYALSFNKGSENAQLAAEKLCQHILKYYYPEHSEIDTMLNRIYGESSILREDNRMEYHRQKIIEMVTEALSQDRARYINWIWARWFFRTEEDYEKLSTNDLKMSLEGSFHFGLGILRRSRAKELRTNEAWEKTISSLRKSTELDPENRQYLMELKIALNDHGNYHFQSYNYRKAAEIYREAINISVKPSFEDEDVIYNNFSLALENIREPRNRVGILDEAIFALRKAQEINPGRRAYVNRLKDIEKRRSMAIKLGEPTYNKTSEPTSISLYFTLDLSSYILSDDGRTLSDKVRRLLNEGMRARFNEEFGVTIPSVTFRDIRDYQPPDGTYVIKLMEIEVVKGRIIPDKRFFPGTSSQLETLRIHGEKMSDPQAGFQGYWINKEDYEKITQAGLELWDAAEYMVRHLESVLQNNIAEFI